MLRRRLVMMTAAIGFAGLVGCADDGTTREPSEQDYDDAAASMGSWMASDQAGETRFMGMSATQGGSSEAAKADGLDLSVDLQMSVDCQNADGTEVPCGDGASSASAEVIFDGSLAFPNLEAEATYDAAWTLAGLNTTTATLNGSATATFDSAVTTWGGTQKTIAFDYAAEYTAVGVDTETGAIVNGVATYEVFFDRQVDRPQGRDTSYTVSMLAEATFDSDGTATLQFDGKRTYDVDLQTGAVVYVGTE